MAELGQRYDFADGSESGLRFCRLKQFDGYLAFYRIVQANVFVYRVLHGSRNLAVILGDVKE